MAVGVLHIQLRDFGMHYPRILEWRQALKFLKSELNIFYLMILAPLSLLLVYIHREAFYMTDQTYLILFIYS